MRTVALSLGLSAVLAAQITKWETSNLPALTVCEILSNPLKFDGQLIRIRDVVRGTREGSWLVGGDCPRVFVTEGYVWPALISLELPGNPLQLHSVDFQFSFESQQKLAPKYKQLKRRLREDCIAWTYTGVFETRKDWTTPEAKTIDPDEASRFRPSERRTGSVDPEIRRRCDRDSKLRHKTEGQRSSASTLTIGASRVDTPHGDSGQ